jgi:hypothetical protein
MGARIVVIDSLNGYLSAMPDESFLIPQMLLGSWALSDKREFEADAFAASVIGPGAVE